MLTIYDLNNDKMLEQPDFFELVSDFDTFQGVSFVKLKANNYDNINVALDNYFNMFPR